MSTSPNATTSPSKQGAPLVAFGGLKAFLPLQQQQQNAVTSPAVTTPISAPAASSDASSASTSSPTTSSSTNTHSTASTTNSAPTLDAAATTSQLPRRQDTDAALSAIDTAMSELTDITKPANNVVEPSAAATSTTDVPTPTQSATAAPAAADNYTPPVLNEVESHWHYAVVCQYFEVFRHYISSDSKTYSFDPHQLIQALQCTEHTCDYEGVPQTKLPFGKQHVVQCRCSRAAVVHNEHVSCCEWLADTHVQLLQLTANQPNTVHIGTWQDHLRQTLEDHFNEWSAMRHEISHPPAADLYPVDITQQPADAPPSNKKKQSPAKAQPNNDDTPAEDDDPDESPLPTDMHYYQQPWQYKLTLLKYLCEWQLEENDVFRQAILELQQQQNSAATAPTTNSKDAPAAPPTTTTSNILGEDDHGNRYYIYLVGDNTARAHLYLEPFHSTDRRLDAYRKGGAASSVTPKDDKPADKKQENGHKANSRSQKPSKPTANSSKKSKHRSSDADNSDSDPDSTPHMNGKTHPSKLDPPTTPPGLQLLASTWQELTDLTQVWQVEYASSTKFQQMLQRLQTEILPELEKQEKAGRRKQRQVGSRRELAELAAFAYVPRSTRTRRPVSYAEDALAPAIEDDYAGPRGRAAARTRRNYNEDDADDDYADQGSDDEPSKADEELAKALANPYSTRRKRAAQVEYGEADDDADDADEEEQQADEEAAIEAEQPEDDAMSTANDVSTTQGQPSTSSEAEMSIPSTPTSAAAPPPSNDIKPLGSLHQYTMQAQQAQALAATDTSVMSVEQPPAG